MWLLKKLWELCCFPVEWFFNKFEALKEEDATGKIILLFVVSLTGLGLFVFAFTCIAAMLVQDFPEVLVILGLIAWLYAYVKEKMVTKQNTPIEGNANTAIHESAVNGYAPMRTVIYKVFKECSTYIGGKTPRMLAEIEVPTEKFLISNGCVYYQFQLQKEEIKTMYSKNDLNEFKNVIQNTFKNLWESGQFPQIALQTYTDGSGIILDPICITDLEDLGNTYLIQSVYTNSAYISQIKKRWESQGASNNTGYSLNDERFL